MTTNVAKSAKSDLMSQLHVYWEEDLEHTRLKVNETRVKALEREIEQLKILLAAHDQSALLGHHDTARNTTIYLSGNANQKRPSPYFEALNEPKKIYALVGQHDTFESKSV